MATTPAANADGKTELARGMKLCMDGTCMSRAEQDIQAGRIHDGVFVPPGEGNCVDGECLARDDDGKPAAPIYKDGKVSIAALHQAEAMAHEGGHTELAAGARRLIEMSRGRMGRYGLSMSREALALSLDGEFRPIEASAMRGLPKERNGKKCFYFDREVLRPGKITLSNGETRDVDDKYIDTVLSNFVKAKANGIEPSLPEGHDKKGQNYGWIPDLKKSATGSLVMTAQALGEKAKDEMLAKKPSVGIFKDVIDQYGNKYPLFLDHVAIVPDPQANNLDDTYYPLAASADRSQHVPMLLARYAGAGEVDMPISATALAAARKLSNKPELPEAEVTDTLAAIATQLSEKNLELARGQATKTPPTARELFFLSRAIETERDKAIQMGWTPVQIRKLSEKLLPAGVKIDAMTLSRTPQTGDDEVLNRMETLFGVIQALGSDRPGGLLYKTAGGGVIALSRETPGDNVPADGPGGRLRFDPTAPPPEGYQGMSASRKAELMEMAGFSKVAVK